MAIARSGHGVRRAQVLGVLREAAGPTSAADVAGSTGLHLNTTRFHLERLVQEGQVARHAERGGARGRPRILYSPQPEQGPRDYRLLADMLTSVVATLDPDGTRSADVGRAWGRGIVPPGGDTVDDEIARLDVALERVGFRQTWHDDGPGPELRIHHCPFIEVAEQQPGVVCTLHRGLLEGAVDALDAPLGVEDLRPFAAPGACVARLRRT